MIQLLVAIVIYKRYFEKGEKVRKLVFRLNCKPCVNKEEHKVKDEPNFVSEYYIQQKTKIESRSLPFDSKYCKRKFHFNLEEVLNALNSSKPKVFICVMFHNNEEVLPFWLTEFERLIQFLKPFSPFVSILESHSTDLTPLWFLFLSFLQFFSFTIKFCFLKAHFPCRLPFSERHKTQSCD